MNVPSEPMTAHAMDYLAALQRAQILMAHTHAVVPLVSHWMLMVSRAMVSLPCNLLLKFICDS